MFRSSDDARPLHEVSFIDHVPQGGPGAGRGPRIVVPVRFSDLVRTWAIVDTGAEWSIVHPDWLAAMTPEPTGQRAAIRTWQGRIEGDLVRAPISLPTASAQVQVDATILVCPEWSHACFLGWRGFLEHVGFAVDPIRRRFLLALP